ncbi:MAG: hypothetical protein KC587_13635 [Nitrospira sp.]|nr:hypothetical protein [Nitrospira sp.]MCA9457701.1 hypothetical protein [Nitrospira sp.]
MKRSTTHYAIFGSAALALVLGLGQTISVQAEEPTTSSTQPDQGVQERAVPRMMNPDAQFEQMQPPPRMRQGFVRQGNNIVARPGYVLEPGPNNQVTVRMASGGGSAGGGQGATHQCSCVHKDIVIKFETCTTTVIGTKATCEKGTGDCQGTCQWTSSTTGFSPERKSMQ